MIIVFKNETFTIQEQGRFPDGSPKLVMFDEDGIPYATLTHFAGDNTMTIPASKGCFWLRNWSENEEIAQFLIDKGIMEYTGNEVPLQFVTYKEAKFKKG